MTARYQADRIRVITRKQQVELGILFGLTAGYRQFLIAVFWLALLQSSCRESGLPSPDSRRYTEFTSAFAVGVAGLQTGEDVRARQMLTRATRLAPGEPAAWANLALLSVRQQDFDAAFRYADKARSLAPENSRIEELLGAIEAKRGKIAESLAHYRRAVELDPKNFKALYSLAEQTERQGSPQDESAAETLLEKLLSMQPNNAAVQIDLLRLAAKRGDNATVLKVLGQLRAGSGSWPPEAQERLSAIAQIAGSPNPRAASVQAIFLRNLLVRDPAYRRNLESIRTPVAFVADPFLSCLRLKNPESRPAPPDIALSFVPAESKAANGSVTWAGAVSLDGSSNLTLVTAGPGGLAIGGVPLLRSETGAAPGRNGVLAVDLDYDYKTDFVVASASGIRIYRQRAANDFEEISSKSKIPANILRGSFTGAYAFDVDLDGDLDIVLGAVSGEPIVLRNNGDLTFKVIQPFKNVDGVLSFARADIDGDGDPDVILIDGHGKPHLFLNERLGDYRELTLTIPDHAAYIGSSTAKVDAEGSLLRIVLLSSDGGIDRIVPGSNATIWNAERFIQSKGAHLTSSNTSLIAADFDNNGATDLIAGDRLLLGDGVRFSSVSLPKGFSVLSAGDINGDGKLDLLAATATGNLAILTNRGSKNYGWQLILPRAANARGDQRINSFGIGGEVEIRAGLLNQKEPIDSPVVHFGLGNQKQTDVARIVWPNGSVQAEFELQSYATIRAQQRLKGSCPSLFAWNGHKMSFVKDSAPWSSALGLHINAQTVAQIKETQEWFKIPGELLQSKDDQYDLRVTAELWETFYIDHYALRAVDHPEGTEIYTDERCAMPPPPLKIYTVSEPQPFATAMDDRGTDVSSVVRAKDGQYLDTFGRGRYQGVTRDHWVELEVPPSAPHDDSLLLIASGWLHPTDATVNIALSQNSDPGPQPLRIEVLDRHSRWITANENLGFLAGKLKTAVIPIGRFFVPGAPRRFRLRTNMEIYWDQLSWVVESSDAITTVRDLAMTKADLEYRGFSRMKQANGSSPEIPDYDHLEGTAQKWRDLEGYYTRFGDVRELLASVDDRYVIQNAGDELRLSFASIDAPPKGWKRDFVMIGDGWVKDGDFNTVNSKTVQPLPYHGMNDNPVLAPNLEGDPEYCRHREDWTLFHTRYVTADSFRRGLWN